MRALLLTLSCVAALCAPVAARRRPRVRPAAAHPAPLVPACRAAGAVSLSAPDFRAACPIGARTNPSRFSRRGAIRG